MKRLSYILFLIALTLFLGGCKKNVNSDGASGEGQLLLLKSSINVLKVSKASTGADNIMPDGLNFGIYVHEKDFTGIGAAPETKNRLYTSLSGSLARQDKFGIYVKPGKSYFVYGYGPRKLFEEGTLGYTKIPFSHGEDVLLPNEVEHLTNVTPERTTVTLDFEHITVQVKFVVQNIDLEGKLVPNGINKGTKVEITGFNAEATLNLITKKLTPVSEDLSAKIQATNTEKVTKLETELTCFFIPENGEKKLDIKITIPKRPDLTASIDKMDWVAGTSYTYYLNIVGMMNPIVEVGKALEVAWEMEGEEEQSDNNVPLPY